MLVRLTIKNYILIHDLEIDFSEGFSVITGETGSGKSILLGALGLILGQRADTGALLDKSSKCIVEGIFSIRGYKLEPLFEQYELDYDDSLIIRREINQGGKSRAFINDTPVNLAIIKEFGDRLVNIHSQHAIITLNEANFQLAVLDNYAGLNPQLNEYRENYRTYLNFLRKLEELRLLEENESGERDYHRFLLDELIAANLKEGEPEESEEKLESLQHAEEIKGGLFKAASMIALTEDNLLSRITEIIRSLQGIERYNPKIRSHLERLQSNYIDLKDLGSELSALEEEIDTDPEQIESLTHRLDVLYRLLKKHHRHNSGELISLRDDLEMRLRSITDLSDQISSTSKEVQKIEEELYDQAQSISQARKVAKQGFEKEIIGNLTKLGMPGAILSVEIKPSDQITRDGIDQVRFLFSANQGIGQREISQAASGGELSRLMLSVKSMISQKNLLPTIIFDEIDNGVSGEIAGKVGDILRSMGNRMQVIAITHLPQIAGKGENHHVVFKTVENKTSTTTIKKITAHERVEEIARMLSNHKVTESARSTARELLNN